MAEKSLDFDKAYALALSIEAAEKDSKDLRSQPQPQLLQYQTQRTPPKPTSVTCYRCGGPHLATVCKHITTVCNHCKKRGHLARVCGSKKKQQCQVEQAKQGESSKFVGTSADGDEQLDQDNATEVLNTIRNPGQEPIYMNISLNDVSVQMELDTGASVSVINKATYDRINVNGSLPPLQAPQVLLKSYTGEAIPVLGTTTLRARYRDKMYRLPRPATVSNTGQTPDLDFLVNHLATTCVTASHIKEWTSKDTVLFQVKRFILTGRPENLHDKELKHQSGDLVYAENFGSSPSWIPATVLHSTGPLSYVVKTTDGREFRRHVDSLRVRHKNSETNDHTNTDCIDPLMYPDLPEVVADTADSPDNSSVATEPQEQPRRSVRTRRPPDYFNK